MSASNNKRDVAGNRLHVCRRWRYASKRRHRQPGKQTVIPIVAKTLDPAEACANLSTLAGWKAIVLITEGRTRIPVLSYTMTVYGVLITMYYTDVSSVS